ncbi:nidogen-2-like [Oncorhynchus keta]|uniref:nidogen-2-like n=1 Tax=Oncorhynchus keta TaxID=8018 RepID=UPI0015FA183A|nr:nidogen-2-like [Oncorhynchus keta]
MATLTIILLVSTAFALGDATIRPMTPCERARYAATHGPIGAYIPTCDAAGRYTPKQCSGSTGYFWCVTTTGQKIQGTDTPPGTAINCSRQNATIQPKTPCERASDAAINGPIGAYIPKCDVAGQYTPKQCSGSTGYCWCVTSTGQKIPGTETLPGTAPIKCPCSDPKIHNIVERAVRSILGEQSNEPRSNLLSPSQVVVEVVPRLLLALWLQPEESNSEHPILISWMAVGMVAAIVEKLSCMLKDPSPHIPFSRAAAFDSV